MVAEGVLLSPIIVKRKCKIIDMPIGDVLGIKIKCWVINIWIQYYMPLIITLKRGIESIGVNQEKYSCEHEQK